MTSIWIAIVFYFKLGEVLSVLKIIGMFVMIGSGVFLSLDQDKEENEDIGLTAEEMKRYGIIAVLISCIPTLGWTLQCYWYKKLISTNRFNATDLAIDQGLFSYSIGFCFFLSYLSMHEFDRSLFLQASAVGLLHVSGNILELMSFETGPGGPIVSLTRF